MIVKMKKVTMLCLPSDKEVALEKLRDLGVMHVEITERIESGEVSVLEQKVAFIDRATALLTTREVKDHSHKKTEMTGQQLCELVLDITDTDAALKKELDGYIREQGRLEPWGQFTQEIIDELSTKDVFVYLCAGTKKDFESIPADVMRKDIHVEGGEHYAAIISLTELDEETLPLATIPEGTSLIEVNEHVARLRREIDTNECRLDDLVHYEQELIDYQTELHQQLEYIINRDGMTNAGAVEYITGYVPVTGVDALTSTAKESGWGLLVNDPSEDDKVPTYVKVPKLFSASKPIFDFIGISPGYHEVDISAFFLIFFTIFFGMIIGDGGYGLIFLAASLFAKFKIKSKSAQQTISLFTILSVATVVWGFLTGNFFGIVNSAEAVAANPDVFQWPAFMGGVEWFKSDQHIQLLCFMIAIVHLTIAHGWKAILQINSVKALGEVGWLGLVWGAFFIIAEMVVKMPIVPMNAAAMYLVGPGLVLMLLFSVNWKDVGDILNFPFGALGGFVDLLSYIRLFAVGLSGYYVAVSFNQLGYGMFEAFPGGMVVGILIIVFGHLLNIALCAMGVLVHGIRLNTLEFSGHLDLEWAGFVFKPFKKLINK